MPSSIPAIELDRVSQVFGQFVALRNVSLTLPAGSSVVLLGENGAGKSTLLRVVAGLSAPTHGELRVLGTAPRELRGRVAYMGHSTMLYDELTGTENLLYFAQLHDPGAGAVTSLTARVADALSAVGLDPSNPRRLGEYSQGMRQRASLARVLLTAPELLLLDEPFSNLDVASAQAMVQGLQAFLDRPTLDGLARTLLLTTHQALLAQPLAKTTLTLRAGQLVSVTQQTSAASPPAVTSSMAGASA